MSSALLWLVGGTGLFRHGLKSFISDTPFVVAAEYESAAGCPEVLDGDTAPELIVIAADAREDAASAVEKLSQIHTDAHILVLSVELSIEEMSGCLRAGARGYLLSGISQEVLLHSLTLIRLGETVFPTELAAAWLAGGFIEAARVPNSMFGDLTPRERDILECLRSGASNKLIARQLGITESTVKIHMKSLVRKLGVQNRTQAALLAMRANIGTDSISNAA